MSSYPGIDFSVNYLSGVALPSQAIISSLSVRDQVVLFAALIKHEDYPTLTLRELQPFVVSYIAHHVPYPVIDVEELVSSSWTYSGQFYSLDYEAFSLSIDEVD